MQDSEGCPPVTVGEPGPPTLDRLELVLWVGVMGRPDAPTVTIVIPAYNVERFLCATLESLIYQSFPDWEAIVVDDGSSDDSANIASAAATADRRVRLLRQTNAGVSSARNHGLSDARGRYIMFLDGDDMLHPDALLRLTQEMAANADLEAAFGTLVQVSESGEILPGQKPLALHTYPSGDLLETVIRENPFANGGQILSQTNTARRIGGFLEKLKLSEDWEFWCRLALAGPFKYIGSDAEVLRLRVRADSISARTSFDWCNHVDSIEAVLSNARLAARFPPQIWEGLSNSVVASHLFEAGRANLIHRRFAEARRLMLQSLQMEAAPKRLALFAIAQAQALTGKTLLNRLRFLDDTK